LNSMKKGGAALHDLTIHVKIKLSALWASVMFCYIYGDYFGLFQPGHLQAMLEGKIPPLGTATQAVLVGTSLMMVIPSVMVFLSLALKANLNRWVNIIFGVIYSVIILITMRGSWAFYIFLGVVEVTLTALVVWYAWNWPKQEAA
jgi:hypothetical protein